jgi:hypothetical protein
VEPALKTEGVQVLLVDGTCEGHFLKPLLIIINHSVGNPDMLWETALIAQLLE